MYTIDAYKAQMNLADNKLHVVSGPYNVVLNLSSLVKSLQEIGFIITYPSPKLLQDIQQFLESLEVNDRRITNKMGMVVVGMFLKYNRSYSVHMAPTDSRLNVDIINETGDIRFRGHVESLDEFKLIWSRIL